jgi:hypothetical protein
MGFSNLIIQKQKLIFLTYSGYIIIYNFGNAYYTGTKKLIQYRMKPKYVDPNTLKIELPYYLYKEPNPDDYYIKSNEYEVVLKEIYNKSFEHFINSLVFPFKMTMVITSYLVIKLNKPYDLSN